VNLQIWIVIGGLLVSLVGLIFAIVKEFKNKKITIIFEERSTK